MAEDFNLWYLREKWGRNADLRFLNGKRFWHVFYVEIFARWIGIVEQGSAAEFLSWELYEQDPRWPCEQNQNEKKDCLQLLNKDVGVGQNKCISGVKRWSCQIFSASIYSDTSKGVLSPWQSYRNLKVIHLNGDCPSEHQEVNDIINFFWSNVSFLISVPLLVIVYPWTFGHLT